MKKILISFLTLMMVLLIPISCFAKSVSVSKSNSEFGTLTGELVSSTASVRKTVSYSTKTTKKASMLIAYTEVQLYSTGKAISSDEKVTGNNTKSVGYYWECHNSTYNSQKMSAFGTHEARGTTSLVGYTSIINF